MGYIARLLPLIIALAALDQVPDKHAAECFAGMRAISHNLVQLGYLVQSFDKEIVI